jgi:hypothetical protein
MYIYTTHFSKSGHNKSVPTAVVGGIPNHNRIESLRTASYASDAYTMKPTIKPAMTLFENP